MTGSVLRLNESFTNQADITAPIAGVRVWLEAGGRLLETRADNNGGFILDDVAGRPCGPRRRGPGVRGSDASRPAFAG